MEERPKRKSVIQNLHEALDAEQERRKNFHIRQSLQLLRIDDET